MSTKQIPAAERNKRLTVQRLKQSVVDAGGHIDESDPTNWEPATNIGTSGKIWASLLPRGSREFFRQEQVADDISHQVNCLYVAGKHITQKMRFVLHGRILNISEPPRNVDENNHSLVFACVEVKEGR